ncbi:MAG: class I SAM-dependent rRNA methyltransferase [Acidobacteriaceae bacterium]
MPRDPIPKPPDLASRAPYSEGPVAVISRRAADRLRAGHVWVYRSDIEHAVEIDAGLVAVSDHRGFPLGTGLWSPTSQIALRLVTTEPHLPPQAWMTLFRERLRQAIQLRGSMLQEGTNACRLVFSEADRLPGLIIDRYGDLILVEILAKALDREDIRTAIVDVLRSELDPLTIVERSDARIRELEQLSEPGEEPLYSAEPIVQLATIFHLNGLAFHYNANAGQKTGAFLDQRLNYAAASRYAHGEALDVCTYQGGFALHLARTCSRVTGVDSSRAALEVAEENLEVNRHRIQASVEWVEANAFDLLRDWSTAGTTFDTVVLDPPAFAKSRRAVSGALRGYKELNLRALKMLRPGGTLVTCSCSHHVSWDEFQAVVTAAAGDAQRRIRLLERRGAAPDHPVILNIAETEYLKCLILGVD